MTARLLVLAEGFPSGSDMAGNFHREQFRLLAAEGFDMTVVVPVPWVPSFLRRRNARWARYADLPERQQESGFDVLRPRYLALPGENVRFRPDLMRYMAVKRLRLPRPGVILAYFAIPTGAVARRLAREWRVPYAVGMLGDDVNIYPRHNERNRRLLRSVLHDAAFAFANGPTLARTAAAIAGRSFDVLSLGASRERYARILPRDQARKALGWPPGKTLGLYVGALTETKGMCDLAAALEQVPDQVQIQVIGSGPMRGRLEASRKITCLGPRQPDEVAMSMCAADFLVHPSHYEGLPTVLVEAGLAKVPVITTDAPGCIDLAADGRALIVPARDPAALAAAISWAAVHPDDLKVMADSMFEHVAELYDLHRNTAKLARTLHEMAKGR